MKSWKIVLLLVLWSFGAQAQVALEWGKLMGGVNSSHGNAVTIDADGNVYTTGFCNGIVDFDPGPGIFNLTATWGIFISKLDPSGNFLWAKVMPGTLMGGGCSNAIITDGSGSVYITGDFGATVDFDPGPGIFNLTSAGQRDIFISKLDSSGNFLWAKTMGGTNPDYGYSIAVDTSGNVYTTGDFIGTIDFDPGPSVFNLTSVGVDVFILKLDAFGNFLWAKNIGGSSSEGGRSIAVDASGNIYTTGYFQGSVDFDPGPGLFNLTPVGPSDVFISKLDSSGTFLWAKAMGGNAVFGSSIVVDNNGNIYTTGQFQGTVDFDPGPGIFNLTSAGNYDIFISKLEASGNFLWAKNMGGSALDLGYSIAVDSNKNVYSIGRFHGTVDFDPGLGIYNLTSVGVDDIFISKLDPSGNFLWAKNIDVNTTRSKSMAVDPNGKIYCTGRLDGTIDIDPGPGIYNLTSVVGDIFVLKLDQQNVFGMVYQDFNQNCVSDSFDVGLANRNLVINPGNLIVTTNSAGVWSIDSLAAGTYSITADTSSRNWQLTCPVTQNFTVVHPDSFTTAPSFGFISNNPCPSPDISIHAPFLRPGFSNQKVYIEACNQFTGTALMDSAYVIVELDSLLSVQSGSLPYISLGNNHYQVNIGDIYPGQCVDFWLDCTLSINAILGQSLCMSAELFPVNACVLDSIPNPFPIGISPCNTSYDNSNISIKAECRNDTIVFIVYNTGFGDMSCFSQVRLYIDGQFILMDSVQLTTGDTAMFVFLGDGRTWRLEVDQHPLHPGNSQPSTTIELCGNENNWTPNLVNILPQDDADPIIDIFCGEVRGSYDPNDKTGYPYGVDSSHYIQQNQDIEYVVRFQNTGTDTAFTVVVRDTLPLELDIFSVRSGASSHDYNFRMYGPRVLEWTFNNIMLPDSNVNEPLSNGFLKFKVKQNQDLPIGTVINNSAAIYFDFNAPVITNTYFHTVDTPSNFYALPFRDTIATTLCSNEPINGYTYIASGQYFQATHTNGIDSLHILDLTIIQTTDSLLMVGTCDSFSLNGQSYNSSGIYTQVLKNAAGCDSTLTINLTIHNNAYTLNQTVCDSLNLNGQSYTNNGTYTQLLTNSNGCDSILTINLTVLQSSSGILSDSTCDNYTLNGQSYSSSGTYTQNLANAAGCDSTLTLNLFVENSTAETLNDSACLGYELNGQNYSISGTYTQVLTNRVGCDSILTLNLNILVDSTLTQFGGTLSANQPNATYQWLDCNTSTPIAGATVQTFVPTANGSYAVQITNGACSATSACYNITNVAVEQLQTLNNIRIYPNPTKNSITIDFGGVVDANIQVFTIAGSSKDAIHRVSTANTTNIDLSDYPAGLYMVVVTVDGQAPQAFKVSKF